MVKGPKAGVGGPALSGATLSGFYRIIPSFHPFCLSKCDGSGEDEGRSWGISSICACLLNIAWDVSGVRTVLGQIGELCFTNFVT